MERNDTAKRGSPQKNSAWTCCFFSAKQWVSLDWAQPGHRWPETTELAPRRLCVCRSVTIPCFGSHATCCASQCKQQAPPGSSSRMICCKSRRFRQALCAGVVGVQVVHNRGATKQKPPKFAPGGLLHYRSLTMTYFHIRTYTIIGAKSFHCPVRDGKEWDQLAMVVRHN